MKRLATTTRHSRPGFSLAEMMIAIGILGIGMLMVAATFPVGIEQTRISTRDTMTPIVAAEALATLDLLLHDRSERIVVERPGSGNPRIERYRLADLLRNYRGVAQRPVSHVVLDVIGGRPNTFDLNAWLRGIEQTTTIDGSKVRPLSPPTGFYPSAGTGAAPRYYWWVRFTVSDPGSGPEVNWTVHVTRTAAAEPDFIGVTSVPATSERPGENWILVSAPGTPTMTGDKVAARLQPGKKIWHARVEHAAARKEEFVVEQVDPDPVRAQGYVKLDRPPVLKYADKEDKPTPQNGRAPAPFQAFLKDPNTGVSAEELGRERTAPIP